MKRQLFLGAFLIGAFFTTQAQTIFSFETTEANTGASYTAGAIDAQNNWSLSGDTPTENAVVSTEWASDGTQSLKLITSNNYFDTDNPNEYGVYSPLLSSVITASAYEISQDVSTDLISETGSNFNLYSLNYDTTTNKVSIVSVIYFNYDGTIYAYNPNGTDDIAIGTFDANTKYTVTTRFNADGNLDYYLNGEFLASVTSYNNLPVNLLSYTIDDWDSSYFVDNIAYNTTLDVKTAVASSLEVYPNPAKDVVNVSNSNNTAINAVQVTDINGRVVKTAKYEGTVSAQVNIADLASGVYMMSISSDNGTTTKKIVKQ